MNQATHDIQQIREIMQRSSRCLSLSGVSGILVGFLALLGAYWANETVYQNQKYFGGRHTVLTEDMRYELLLIGTLVLSLSLAAVLVLSYRKAKAQGLPIWDAQARRLVANLAIPLATGGLFCLLLLSKNEIAWIAPSTLIFYGLALINASKYTFNDIRSLGVVEILLGLLAGYWIGHGLIFWAVGFGVLHMVYGAWMWWKYEV